MTDAADQGANSPTSLPPAKPIHEDSTVKSQLDRIESARLDDFLNVAALDRIAWPSVPDVFIPDGEHIWRVWAEHATLLVARRIDGTAHSETGDLIGALVQFPTRGGELFLHKIMVHPDHRGRGVGTRLMRHALGAAGRSVLLTVAPENTAAVQLYTSLGFRQRELVAGYYRPHEHRLVMEHPGFPVEAASGNPPESKQD